MFQKKKKMRTDAVAVSVAVLAADGAIRHWPCHACALCPHISFTDMAMLGPFSFNSAQNDLMNCRQLAAGGRKIMLLFQFVI